LIQIPHSIVPPYQHKAPYTPTKELRFVSA